MIAGTIIMEDTTLTFAAIGEGSVAYTVSDSLTGEVEHLTAGQSAFFGALAIALHNDGTPNYLLDYTAAEAIQRKIRWIP